MVKYMNNTKNIVELSDDDLINIATQAETFITETKKNKATLESTNEDVMEFFALYNIKVGNNKVKTIDLFRLYKSWSERRIKKPRFVVACQNILQVEDAEKYIYINFVPVSNKRKNNLEVDLTDMFNFIQENKVKKGDYTIHCLALQMLYKDWARRFKRKKLGINRFNKAFNKYFKQEYLDGEIYYKMDEITKRKCEMLINEENKKTEEPIPSTE